MKTNKFRGMSQESVWVHGDLIQTTTRVDGSVTSWIKERSALGLGTKSTPTESFIEVKSETIGQFTGIIDYHGVEVYEGTILRVKMGCSWQEKLFLVEDIWDLHIWLNDKDLYVKVNSFEVVGNIYQNANLIGKY